MRRIRPRTEGDYDSVLDTMTNVVGILVIVVAVTQLNVSSAVGRARAALIAAGEVADHPPVSESVMEGARARRQEAADRLATLREREEAGGTDGVDAGTWAELRDRLAKLPVEVSTEELGRRIERAKREIEALEREIRALEGKIERYADLILQMEEQLEALKGRTVDRPPPLLMRLPDPDASRVSGLEVRGYLATGGRILAWDPEPALERWREESESDWKEIPAVRFTLRSKLLWLADRWTRRRYQTETLRLRFVVLANEDAEGGYDLCLVVEPRSDAPGTTLAELKAGKGDFVADVKRLSHRRQWLYFRVYDDSFECYLRARALAEDAGFAVGWVPYGREESMIFSFSAGGSGKPLRAD